MSTDGRQKGNVLPVKVVDEGLKQTLTKVLLEVYMADPYAPFRSSCRPLSTFRKLGADRAAHLLDSQARSLDVSDVSHLLCAILISSG